MEKGHGFLHSSTLVFLLYDTTDVCINWARTFHLTSFPWFRFYWTKYELLVESREIFSTASDGSWEWEKMMHFTVVLIWLTLITLLATGRCFVYFFHVCRDSLPMLQFNACCDVRHEFKISVELWALQEQTKKTFETWVLKDVLLAYCRVCMRNAM